MFLQRCEKGVEGWGVWYRFALQAIIFPSSNEVLCQRCGPLTRPLSKSNGASSTTLSLSFSPSHTYTPHCACRCVKAHRINNVLVASTGFCRVVCVCVCVCVCLCVCVCVQMDSPQEWIVLR